MGAQSRPPEGLRELGLPVELYPATDCRKKANFYSERLPLSSAARSRAVSGYFPKRCGSASLELGLLPSERMTKVPRPDWLPRVRPGRHITSIGRAHRRAARGNIASTHLGPQGRSSHVRVYRSHACAMLVTHTSRSSPINRSPPIWCAPAVPLARRPAFVHSSFAALATMRS